LLLRALAMREHMAAGPAIQIRCVECGFAEAPETTTAARQRLTPALLALIGK
jgi:hypothetical protein